MPSNTAYELMGAGHCPGKVLPYPCRCVGCSRCYQPCGLPWLSTLVLMKQNDPTRTSVFSHRYPCCCSFPLSGPGPSIQVFLVSTVHPPGPHRSGPLLRHGARRAFRPCPGHVGHGAMPRALWVAGREVWLEVGDLRLVVCGSWVCGVVLGVRASPGTGLFARLLLACVLRGVLRRRTT